MSSAAVSAKAAASARIEARAPVRARGHARGTAILDAAAALFADKGFDAATMTEIAARSQTAVGSLYRFFPTKAALADALLARYAETLAASLAEIEARADMLAPAALADALFDAMTEQRTDRTVAVALVDLRPDGADRRAEIRDAARLGIAGILSRAAPHLSAAAAADAAAALLQMLKGARILADAGAGPIAALRTAIHLYVAYCLEASR